MPEGVSLFVRLFTFPNKEKDLRYCYPRPLKNTVSFILN